MIYQICDIMMSIRTWDKVHFWIYPFNHNWCIVWRIDKYKQGQYEQFGGLGLSSRSFSIKQPPPIIHCQDSRVSFFKKDEWRTINIHCQDSKVSFLKKAEWGTIKNGKFSLYYNFNKILKWPGTSFQSPSSSQKHVRNICHTAH